jgi:Protein of unknown function (DUF3313)
MCGAAALAAQRGRAHDARMSLATLRTVSRRSLFPALMLLAACASSQRARNLDINDPNLHRMLTQGLVLERTDDSEKALYVYQAKDLPKVRYTKLLLDPVVISKQGNMDETQAANYQALADNAFQLVRKELSQDFEIATEPGPTTFRLQLAILDAEAASRIRRVLASASPVGRGLSLASYVVTGKPTAVGEITIEILITDSQSGKVLGAGIDRRVGTEDIRAAVDVWATANDAIATWAKRLREQLMQVRQARKLPTQAK